MSVDRVAEKLEALYVTGARSDGLSILENSLEVFKSVKCRADPGFNPRQMPKRNESIGPSKNVYPDVQSGIIRNSQKVEPMQMDIN